MKNLLALALLSTLVFAGSGCVNREAQSQSAQTEKIVKDPVIPVRVTSAKLTSYSETLSITGSITSDSDSQVTALTGGRLIQVSVRDGDSVVAGQVLAIQESQDARNRVRQAEAGLRAARSALSQVLTQARVAPQQSSAAVKAARAQLAQAEAALRKLKNGARSEERAQAEANLRAARAGVDVAKAQLDRSKKLLAEGAISQREFDQAFLAYESAISQFEAAQESLSIVKNVSRPEDIQAAQSAVEAARQNVQQALAAQKLDAQWSDQISAAQANVESAQEQVGIAQKSVDDSIVRAPFSGKVSGKPLQAGQFVGPGTPILRLVGAGGTYFEAEVPETAVTSIEAGQDVMVKIEALGGRTIAGRVAAINPLANSLGRLFTVRVSLDSVDGGLKSGMFARGEIELRQTPGVFSFSKPTVLRSNSDSAVYVVSGDKALRRKIQVIGESEGLVFVRGISEGDQVVTSGQSNLTDGAKVRIEEGA